jgi:hypothetical protein
MSHKMRLLVVLSLALMGVAAIVPGARAAAVGRLAVTALSFSPTSIDASTGAASATLTWTVTDTNANATDIAGEVDIREEGPYPGSYVGMASVATFDLTGALTSDVTGNGSGTAQKATFSYTFSVPQYTKATTARWVVSDVTVKDDQGASADISGVRLTGFHAALNATELPDTTAPSYDQFSFASPSQRPFLYDNGTSASLSYSIEVIDPDSGFWKGTVALSGPAGQHALGAFDAEYSVTDGLDVCGQGIGFGTQDIICTATVTIPANAAAGTWSVSAITLTDNAGNTQAYRGLNELPVTVTADKLITASGFSVNPSQVNDWGTFGNTTLTMTVTGETGGVTAIYVDGTPGACGQHTTTPTLNSDGTYSVPMYMVIDNPKCTITGIAVVDGAGHVSLYGSEYGAPDPGVTITQVPDTTPPVATAASLSSTTLPYSANQQDDLLTITIDDPVAPVNQFGVFLYDSSGNGGELSFGGISSTLNGTITLDVPISGGTAPGTYTVGFELVDVAGLTSFYGTMPNGLPVPGGPLTLTITPS